MSVARHEGSSAWRLQAVLLSLLVHAAILGALGWGWWHHGASAPVLQQLAIEATVVIDKTTTPAPADSAAAAPAQAAPAPAPTPPPDTQAQQQQRAEHERELQQAADERAEHERVLREQREQAAADARRREQETAARKAADDAQRAKDKARRESELRAQLAQEERINAARGSAAATAWIALIRDRVTQAWNRPPSARAGLNCEVRVTQVPGGVVTGVEIGSCNGDAAVRDSIEAAVYRASPLPSPSNPDLFDRNLKFNFRPDE